MTLKNAILKLRAMINPKVTYKITDTEEIITISDKKPKKIKPPKGEKPMNNKYVTSKQFDEFKDIVLGFITRTDKFMQDQLEFNKTVSTFMQDQLEFNKNIVSKNNLKI